jgi:hypothetical protein
MTLAPAAIPAQSALAIASLAVQGFADVETLGGPRPTSLYALTIALSGERKSSCDGLLMAGLRQFEKEQWKLHRSELASWQNGHALWRLERERILAEAKKGKGAKRAAAEADLVNLGSEPAAPPAPDRTVTEPTFEGLTRKFAEGLPTLGIFSDEGGQFLGGFAMSSDHRLKTLAALNDAWQGNPIRRTRAGEGSFTLYGRRLAMHLMVQPAAARAFMADPITGDTGFLPRFLICEPASTIGTRLHALARTDGLAIERFGDRLASILQASLPMDPETRELTPRLLPLASGARRLLVQFSDAVEAAQAPKCEYAHITGYASKSAEQAARIAGVLALWPDLDAKEVSDEQMACGVALAKFYLSEAARLADASKISVEIEQAERLRNLADGHLGALRDRAVRSRPARADPLTARDPVCKGCPRASREARLARSAARRHDGARCWPQGSVPHREDAPWTLTHGPRWPQSARRPVLFVLAVLLQFVRRTRIPRVAAIRHLTSHAALFVLIVLFHPH